MHEPIALRLRPGADLRVALEELVRVRGLPAACVVTCVGSLARAALRLADASTTTEREGPFEILSLVGTLSPDGPHLHVALADAHGATWGGHLLPGCVVHTTAEVVVQPLPHLRFARERDPATGWNELVVRPSGS